MRQLDPVYVPMMNTTTWFLDGGRVRVMQPQSGRDVILPRRRFGRLWTGLAIVVGTADGLNERGSDGYRQAG